MIDSTLVYLILIGFVAGIMGGLFGVGGAIIVTPALVFILGFSQKLAQGTTLAMLLPPIGILAVWQYYKQGTVNIKYALILALFFIVGSYFGSKLALQLDNNKLQKGFSLLLMFIAIKLFFK